MSGIDANKLLLSLLSKGKEDAYIEFKHDNSSENNIGERISALSNIAAIEGRVYAYLVYRIEDKTLKIVGTHFRPKQKKVGNEDLKPWIEHNIQPRMSILPLEITIDGKNVSILRIPAAKKSKTTFKSVAYIRVDSTTILLDKRPDLESGRAFGQPSL